MKQTNNGIGTSYPEAHITRSKSKNRGRLKIYNHNTVYLDQGEEFEIEVFNPTTKTILAKIDFNGEMISHSGLVLRPGQRVFLERFFDDNRKFKFEVYEVENTDKAIAEAGIAKVNASAKIAEATAREKMNEFLTGKALEDNILSIEQLKKESENLNELESELNLKANQIKHATEYNGDLKVFFFNESEPKQNPYTIIKGGYNPWDNPFGTWHSGNTFHTNNTTLGDNPVYGSGFSNISSDLNTTLNSSLSDDSVESNGLFGALRSKSLYSDDSLKSKSLKRRVSKETKQEDQVKPEEFFSQSLSMEDLKSNIESLTDGKFDDTSETGRIGQGGLSEQSFKSVEMDFDQYTFHSIEYKMLPTSNKPIETNDLKQYCCQCGKKLKKTDKFCANCGTKVD
jgi:hypothetical protein